MAPLDGEALYVWQVWEGGGWGTVAVIMPDISDRPIPMVTRSRLVADRWEPIARAHHEATGLDVRLGRFVVDEILRALP